MKLKLSLWKLLRCAGHLQFWFFFGSAKMEAQLVGIKPVSAAVGECFFIFLFLTYELPERPNNESL